MFSSKINVCNPSLQSNNNSAKNYSYYYKNAKTEKKMECCFRNYISSIYIKKCSKEK